MCMLLQSAAMLVCILSLGGIVPLSVGTGGAMIFWGITLSALCSFNYAIAGRVLKAFEFWFFQVQGLTLFIALSYMFSWDARSFIASIYPATAIKLGLLDANVDVPVSVVITRWAFVFLLCCAQLVMLQFKFMPNTDYGAEITVLQANYTALGMVMSYLPIFVTLSFKMVYGKFAKPTTIVMVKVQLMYDPAERTQY